MSPEPVGARNVTKHTSSVLTFPRTRIPGPDTLQHFPIQSFRKILDWALHIEPEFKVPSFWVL